MAENNLTGSELLNYKVTEKIGEGGMGEVYKAWDQNLKRHVAIKVLKIINKELSKELTQRFLSEARALAQLKHPAFTTIFEISDGGDFPIIVMEYLEGKNLKEYIKDVQPSIREILNIFLAAAKGFQYLHEKEIFHRDIKPSNLFFTHDNELKIIDLGIAKWKEDRESFETKTYQFIGSVNFSAPELFSMEKASPVTEVYSLGLSLLSLLSGESLFTGDSPSDIVCKIRHDAPEISDTFENNLPEPLKDFIFLCIEKNPILRLKNMKQFHEALKSLISLFSDQFLALKPADLQDENLELRHGGLKKEVKKDNNIFTMTLSRNELEIRRANSKKPKLNQAKPVKKIAPEKKTYGNGQRTAIVASVACILSYWGYSLLDKPAVQEKTVSNQEIQKEIVEIKPVEVVTQLPDAINPQHQILLNLIKEVKNTNDSSLLAALEEVSILYKEAKQKNISLPYIDSQGMDALRSHFEQKEIDKCLSQAIFFNKTIKQKLSGSSEPTRLPSSINPGSFKKFKRN